MSFDNLDMSNADGRPVLLFELMYGNTTFYYCNADRDIAWGGNTYVGSNFSHEGITQTGDPQSDAITINCPASIDLVQQWNGTPPTDQVFLTIREKHLDDPDDEARVAWIGTVSDVRNPTLMTAQIIGQTLSMSFKRGGLRLGYTRGCPYFVYDVNCTLNPDNFAVNCTVTAVGPDWFEAAEVGDHQGGWFSGGFMKFERVSGAWERYGIEESAGRRCTLMGAADRLEVGMAVIAYPGCARILSVCHDKFGNDINHGGFKGMPGRSPFDGNPVF